MAVPLWPVAVPYEQAADSAVPTQPYRAPLMSETEGGIGIMRPRPGPRIAEIPFKSVLLDGTQWAAFEAFTRADLYHGTLVFDMLVFKPGAGYVSRKCQIKGGLWTTDESEIPHFRVSFTLLVYNW